MYRVLGVAREMRMGKGGLYFRRKRGFIETPLFAESNLGTFSLSQMDELDDHDEALKRANGKSLSWDVLLIVK